MTYTNLPRSLCQPPRARAKQVDKPGKLQGQHTCSAHASLVVQRVSFSWVFSGSQRIWKGSAVTWYNIHFVSLLIKDGSKLRKQHRPSGKEKESSARDWKPTCFTPCWQPACARNKCNKSERYVVLIIHVISDFFGHHEDEDQQALYPVISVSHPWLTSTYHHYYHHYRRQGCGSWQMQNDDLEQR